MVARTLYHQIHILLHRRLVQASAVSKSLTAALMDVYQGEVVDNGYNSQQQSSLAIVAEATNENETEVVDNKTRRAGRKMPTYHQNLITKPSS